MKISPARVVVLLGISFSLAACSESGSKPQVKTTKVTVATVQKQAVTLTQSYHCQINSHHHIKIRAPESGIVAALQVQAGQSVKQGDLLFQLTPTISKENRDDENAIRMTSILAPFDGMIDRLQYQKDALVQKGETLTSLSDNSLMWVYFNVPEAHYLEYNSANLEQHKDELKFELMLANGKKFDHPGKFGAIGANFNSGTGSVPFRADFPNPDHVLRHGQTGVLTFGRVNHDAIVVPQRATLEILRKRYVFVVDKDDVVHQREIVLQNELDGLFVIKSGVAVGDKIVVEGIRQIEDGDKVTYDTRQSKSVAVNLE